MTRSHEDNILLTTASIAFSVIHSLLLVSKKKSNIFIEATDSLHLDIPAMIQRRSLRLHLNQCSLLASSLIDTRRPKWIRLPYLGNISLKMEKQSTRYDFKVGFYPYLSLSWLINIDSRFNLLSFRV